MYRDKNNVVQDSFQSFLVEKAAFTPVEEYPIIDARMVPTEPPKKIIPFSKAISFRGDLHEYFVCFYSPDSTFERVRRNPKRYVPFLQRCGGIIGLDFSVHTDMPIVKQKSQLNDNLSLSYFFAQQGIPLFPNCRGGSDCVNDDYIRALPKHSYLALGTNGFTKRRHQKCEWRVWIDKLIHTLDPRGFIVVGPLPQTIIGDYKDDVEFHIFDSFISERRKRSHVN